MPMDYATYEPVILTPEDTGGLYDYESAYNSPYLEEIYKLAGMDNVKIEGVKLNTDTNTKRDLSMEEVDPFAKHVAKTKKGNRFQLGSSSFSTTKNERERLAEFNKAYDEYEKINPEARKNRAFLTKVAFNESGFNQTSKNPHAPAYGYFQFMQDGKKYNNIIAYSGASVKDFLANPILQIASANKMINDIERQLTKKDIERLNELGLTRNAAYGMAWLGGVGGLRNFIHSGINASDSSWYGGSGGVDMKEQIRRYNF